MDMTYEYEWMNVNEWHTFHKNKIVSFARRFFVVVVCSSLVFHYSIFFSHDFVITGVDFFNAINDERKSSKIIITITTLLFLTCVSTSLMIGNSEMPLANREKKWKNV